MRKTQSHTLIQNATLYLDLIQSMVHLRLVCLPVNKNSIKSLNQYISFLTSFQQEEIFSFQSTVQALL